MLQEPIAPTVIPNCCSHSKNMSFQPQDFSLNVVDLEPTTLSHTSWLRSRLEQQWLVVDQIGDRDVSGEERNLSEASVKLTSNECR